MPFQAAAVSERRFAELVMANYEVLDSMDWPELAAHCSHGKLRV